MHSHSAFAQRVLTGLALLVMAGATAQCAGCPTPVRLQANYENEAVNTVPQNQPTPSPPHDFFNWGVIDVTARVIQIGNQGHWVTVKPTTAYLSKGKIRAFVGYAWSEPITAGAPQLRGGLRVNMQGSGRMVIAIRIVHPNDYYVPIGGYLLTGEEVAYMNTQNLQVMDKNDLIVNATSLFVHKPSFTVSLRWSLDQASRTINLGASSTDGASNTETGLVYEANTPNGTPNTPIPKILMETQIFEARQDTVAYFDDFLVEEIGR